MRNIIQGDCLTAMKEMSDNSIDLVVTSPPYDNIREYGNLKHFTFETFKPIAGHLARVLKDGGVIMWNVGDETIDGSESGSSFKQALYFKEGCGLRLHDTMIYQKPCARFCAGAKSNRYSQIFEYMFVFSKGKPKTNNLIADKPNKWAGTKSWGNIKWRDKNGELVSDGRKSKEIKMFGVRGNVWLINNTGYGRVDKRIVKHPATMPMKMAEDHIRTWSEPGDVVLDPFAGSGTTLVAAKKLGRNYVGIEINPDYIEIIKERLK